MTEFPTGFVLNAAGVLTVWAGLHATTVHGSWRSRTGALAVAFALTGSIIGAVLSYQLPVGTYEWSNGVLADGRYALAAESSDTLWSRMTKASTEG